MLTSLNEPTDNGRSVSQANHIYFISTSYNIYRYFPYTILCYEILKNSFKRILTNNEKGSHIVHISKIGGTTCQLRLNSLVCRSIFLLIKKKFLKMRYQIQLMSPNEKLGGYWGY